MKLEDCVNSKTLAILNGEPLPDPRVDAAMRLADEFASMSVAHAVFCTAESRRIKTESRAELEALLREYLTR